MEGETARFSRRALALFPRQPSLFFFLFLLLLIFLVRNRWRIAPSSGARCAAATDGHTYGRQCEVRARERHRTYVRTYVRTVHSMPYAIWLMASALLSVIDSTSRTLCRCPCLPISAIASLVKRASVPRRANKAGSYLTCSRARARALIRRSEIISDAHLFSKPTPCVLRSERRVRGASSSVKYATRDSPTFDRIANSNERLPIHHRRLMNQWTAVSLITTWTSCREGPSRRYP